MRKQRKKPAAARVASAEPDKKGRKTMVTTITAAFVMLLAVSLRVAALVWARPELRHHTRALPCPSKGSVAHTTAGVTGGRGDFPCQGRQHRKGGRVWIPCWVPSSPRSHLYRWPRSPCRLSHSCGQITSDRGEESAVAPAGSQGAGPDLGAPKISSTKAPIAACTSSEPGPANIP
jgi:hypothetical protein